MSDTPLLITVLPAERSRAPRSGGQADKQVDQIQNVLVPCLKLLVISCPGDRFLQRGLPCASERSTRINRHAQGMVHPFEGPATSCSSFFLSFFLFRFFKPTMSSTLFFSHTCNGHWKTSVAVVAIDPLATIAEMLAALLCPLSTGE